MSQVKKFGGFSLTGGLSSFIGSPVVAPFSPTDLPDLLFWLDGQDPFNNGTIPADGTPISTWVDKSGNGYDAIQGGIGVQPLFQYDVIGSFPSLSFNGSQSLLGVPTTLIANPQFSAFYVIAISIQTTNRVALSIGTGNGNYETQGFGYNFGFGSSYSSFEWGGYESLYAPSDLNAHYISSIRSTTTNQTTLYVDSNIQTSAMGVAGPLNVSANYSIGRHGNGFGLFWLGFVAEVIFYSREVSNTERLEVQNYLKNKWGL